MILRVYAAKALDNENTACRLLCQASTSLRNPAPLFSDGVCRWRLVVKRRGINTSICYIAFKNLYCRCQSMYFLIIVIRRRSVSMLLMRSLVIIVFYMFVCDLLKQMSCIILFKVKLLTFVWPEESLDVLVIKGSTLTIHRYFDIIFLNKLV